jgi:hypothetical protein
VKPQLTARTQTPRTQQDVAIRPIVDRQSNRNGYCFGAGQSLRVDAVDCLTASVPAIPKERLTPSVAAGGLSLAVERFDARAWPDEQLEPLFGGAFPAFIAADQVAAAYIGRVREWFAEFNIILLDEDESPVATGWGVPIRWSGELHDLPTGYTDTTRRAVEDRQAGHVCDTFVICGGIVDRSRSRQGLTQQLVTALRDLPAAASLTRVIAPVRPTRKSSYPLTPIGTYAAWTRDDGSPLDPWLRTHVRLGGRIIAVAPHSQTMTGTVNQWQGWTGLRLPSTSHYVIPDGLAPLYVDRERDVGTYTEPNVWTQHR